MVKTPQRDLSNFVSLNGLGLTTNNTTRRSRKAARKAMAAFVSPRNLAARGSPAARKPSQNESSILWGTMVFRLSHFINELKSPSLDDIVLPPAMYEQNAKFISELRSTAES